MVGLYIGGKKPHETLLELQLAMGTLCEAGEEQHLAKKSVTETCARARELAWLWSCAHLHRNETLDRRTTPVKRALKRLIGEGSKRKVQRDVMVVLRTSCDCM